jgi:hypothetical protein
MEDKMSVEIIEGFDKRDWNGYLTPENAKKFGLVGIKVSQGRSWTPKDIAVLQKQWARANSIYKLARIPFHFWLAPWPGQDYEQYGRDQAKNMFNGIKTKFKNDYGELPPAIDVEHRFFGMASGLPRAKTLLGCLQKTEQLWGEVPLIYTAGYYWDKLVHPYFVQLVPEYWKYYELWEADPPPDTSIKGWGDTNAIQQIVLDQPYPGFSGGVDINETTQEWLDKFLKPELPPPPPPPNCIPAQKAVLNQVLGFTKDLRDSL